MLSDYQNREKKIPCLWNKSFIGMEQKFSLHETIISCRGNVSFFLFQTGCVQDMFDGFTQSGYILTSGCCKMRLTASAAFSGFAESRLEIVCICSVFASKFSSARSPQSMEKRTPPL